MALFAGVVQRETGQGLLNWSRPRNRVVVKGVLTDNGSCYRSYAFKDALGPDSKHKRTRPYRPQTNGKVERYNRTLLDEWAYAKC